MHADNQPSLPTKLIAGNGQLKLGCDTMLGVVVLSMHTGRYTDGGQRCLECPRLGDYYVKYDLKYVAETRFRITQIMLHKQMEARFSNKMDKYLATWQPPILILTFSTLQLKCACGLFLSPPNPFLFRPPQPNPTLPYPTMQRIHMHCLMQTVGDYR